MAAGANTRSDIGVRRMISQVTPPQYRNFEPNGTQTYIANASHGYWHGGVTYAMGQTIPYDAAGGTLYTDSPTMERDFNARLIYPSS
jgi:hypothetical protein